MANPFSPEFNRLVFQSLYFMEVVFDVLDDEIDDDEDKIDEYWKVETDADDGGPAGFVAIDLRRKGAKDSYMDITRVFPQPGCADAMPLYLNVLREDEDEVFDDLKAEFKEAAVNDEDLRLGFEWPLGEGATNEEIREAARAFGKRVVKAVWGE